MRRLSRRRVLAAGLATLSSAATSCGARRSASLPAPSAPLWRMPSESADTPRICLGAGAQTDDAGMRRLKQIGVDHVLMGGPRMPWNEADLRSLLDRFRAGGLTVCNLMISGFDDVIWGRPGADAQIADVITSIRAAGRVGLPVVEYNFYAHRLIEGYKEETGRAGAGYTAYDYSGVRNLPPREGVGHALACRSAEAGRALPESRRAGSGEGQRAAGTPPKRSARANQPWIGTADGHRRALERVPASGGQPPQRHDVRLRCHARDGRGSGGGLPLPRRARPHQPRPLPQRRRANAVRGLHRGVPRHRASEPVRRDARAACVRNIRAPSTRSIRGPSTSIARPARSGTRTRAAAVSPARSTTSRTPGPCCRPL